MPIIHINKIYSFKLSHWFGCRSFKTWTGYTYQPIHKTKWSMETFSKKILFMCTCVNRKWIIACNKRNFKLNCQLCLLHTHGVYVFSGLLSSSFHPSQSIKSEDTFLWYKEQWHVLCFMHHSIISKYLSFAGAQKIGDDPTWYWVSGRVHPGQVTSSS